MFRDDVKHCADIRVYNKKKIIELLIHGGKTKKQLADTLGISVATASSLCNTLTQDGYLRSESTNSSNGGRIPQELHVRREACWAVCLNLVEKDIITLALVDLCGNIVEQKHEDCRHTVTAEQLMEFSAACIGAMLQERQIPPEKVMGIGVAVSGNELEGSHTIQNCSANPRLNGVNIRSALEKAFPGTAVCIENEANEAVLALYHKEHIQDPSIQDAVYLYIGDGVGVGIIAGGNLIRGHHGVGGEINHIGFGTRGYECYCGQKNCLETEISVVGFQRKFFEDSGIDHPFNRYGWDLFEEAVRQGSAPALNLIAENGALIGRAISVLSHIFDAKAYWIGGFDAYIFEKLYPHVMEEVERRSIFNHLFRCDVRFDEGFHNIITLGCYQLVFQNWLP